MSGALLRFISALRAADVRVSAAECLDALAVAECVGFSHRALFRDAMGQALAKTPGEKAVFADVFERFFSPAASGGAEASALPAALPAALPQEPGVSGPASGALEEMLRGDEAGLSVALARAGAAVGVDRIRVFTQTGIYTRRIMDAAGGGALTDAMIAAAAAGDAAREAQLAALRTGLRRRVRDYVEHQLALHAAQEGRRVREEALSRIRLSNVEWRDLKLMHEVVRRMAKRLVALHGRRRRVARRGRLDMRSTLRRNLAHDGLLFKITWKRVRRDRPKLMAVCDVSGSMASFARFLLMFLYSLGEVAPGTRAFAFSGRLGEVTEVFAREDVERAIAAVLREHGGGVTDYGCALEDMAALALDDVDRRTTVIILGDARSNYGAPRADLLKALHDRARRVIWLNPEPSGLWGTGDSEMLRFAPYCRARVCQSLKDLERVMDMLLRHAG